MIPPPSAIARPIGFQPHRDRLHRIPRKNLNSPAASQAQIIQETPNHITISYNLSSPGLIAISDLWDGGWRARANGVESKVLRVNHAFRGVELPPAQASCNTITSQ